MAKQTSGDISGSSTASFAAGWGLWLAWIAASTVGWAVGGSIAAALSSPAETIEAGSIIVAAGSVLTGLLQSLVLRRQLDVAARWVLATIGAVAAIGVLVFAVRVFDAGVGTAATGTALGVTQWMALRRRVAQAGWWVLASTIGWIAGGFLSGAFEGGIAGWTTIGIVYGAITGSALVWLLRHRSYGPSRAVI